MFVIEREQVFQVFACNDGKFYGAGKYDGLEIFGAVGNLHVTVREDGNAGIFGQVVIGIVDDDGGFAGGAENPPAMFHLPGGLVQVVQGGREDLII